MAHPGGCLDFGRKAVIDRFGYLSTLHLAFSRFVRCLDPSDE